MFNLFLFSCLSKAFFFIVAWGGKNDVRTKKKGERENDRFKAVIKIQGPFTLIEILY